MNISGSLFAQAVISAANHIINEKSKVDELNVFPVPDGDTGTNMSMTMTNGKKAVEALEKSAPIGEVAKAFATALLRGARGNSGVILSLLFRGFSKGLGEAVEASGEDLVNALGLGVDAAYKAVMTPTEGTILTVARVAYEKGRAAAAIDNDPAYVWAAVCMGAGAALEETPELLPVLKKAGVVDAGGKGFLVILQGMLDELRGEPMPEGSDESAPAAPKDRADFESFSTEEIKFGYCTEFICSRDNKKKDPEALRGFLNALGDSLVLVEDDDIIKVHVHTNHPGKVLEEALTYGALQTVKIENMRNQHSEILEEAAQAPAQEEHKAAAPEKPYGFVAVCAGEGVAAVFRDLGADGIISGGQTMNPSTDDILREIDATPAEIVFVLPNNKNIIMAAEQCIRLVEGKQVVVLPTKTVPQGISALMVMDPEADTEANVQAMQEALSRVHTSEITYAARDSDFDGFAIKRGDYLALTEHQLFGTDRKVEKLLRRLAEADDQQNAEFINIFYGEDVTEREAQKALKLFTECCPNAEITLLSGGQPVYYYMISAE